jgi:bacillithiol biosynthesis deacetylase BshB1
VPFDVVVFGAHPDDAEMGMGGTVAKLCRAGRTVLITSLTAGERGAHGDAATRRREAAASARILGCEYRILDFPDTRVENSLAARERLAHFVREAQPRLVFAPYHTSRFGHHDGATHVDHLATGAMVRDAVKLARLGGVDLDGAPPHDVQRLFYYMVPRDVVPSVVVDVSAHMDTLVQALGAYATQMRITRRGNAILDILTAYRRFHGVGAGCAHAEVFLCEEALRADADTLFRL